MAVVIKCPECENAIRVTPELSGKKIRCTAYSTAFVVKLPKSAPKATPTKKEATPANTIPLAKDDDDDDDGNPYGVEAADNTVRCPHCTNVMEPPGAVICLHCGYNMRTRTRAAKKTVYEHTNNDYMYWLAPGILCLVGAITLLAIDLICYLNFPKWLEGSFLQNDDKTWIVKPGAFSLYVTLFTLLFIVPMSRFAYKRLVLNPHPPEQLKGDMDEEDEDDDD